MELGELFDMLDAEAAKTRRKPRTALSDELGGYDTKMLSDAPDGPENGAGNEQDVPDDDAS